MKRLRVLHVITRFILGGAQETALLSCALIDRERFPSEILSGPQTGSEGELFSDAARRGVKVHVLPDLVREVRPIKDTVALIRLVSFFRTYRPDIVHTNSSKAGILGRVAARIARVPFVVHTIHGWGFHPRQAWFERFAYQTLERWCAPLSNYLVVVGAVHRDQGLGLGIGRPDQYRLIRSGIEIEAYRKQREEGHTIRERYGFERDHFVFGSLGRLSPQKAPLDLIEAFAEVVGEETRARLILVGDGPLRSQVEAAIERLRLKPYVRLAGLQRDIIGFLSAFDAFVITSRWEGLPRTVPQAMAAGLPVIATAVDGTPEAVQDGTTGFLVIPGDRATLVDRMLRFVRDREVVCRFGTAAERAVEEFSAQAMVHDLEGLYGHLADSISAR